MLVVIARMFGAFSPDIVLHGFCQVAPPVLAAIAQSLPSLPRLKFELLCSSGEAQDSKSDARKFAWEIMGT